MPELKEYTTRSGKKFLIDISNEACAPFGFIHGQRVETNIGEATVIGVAFYKGYNQLWFAADEDKGKISCWPGRYSKKDFDRLYFRVIDKIDTDD